MRRSSFFALKEYVLAGGSEVILTSDEEAFVWIFVPEF